jgi:hypothetical protein
MQLRFPGSGEEWGLVLHSSGIILQALQDILGVSMVVAVSFLEEHQGQYNL